MNNELKGKLFKNFDNETVQVLDVVVDAIDETDAVVYRSLDLDHKTYTMPKEEFECEFSPYTRNFETGLKAFIALKFYEGDESKQLVDGITNALSPLNINTFVAVRDIEKYGEVQGLDMAHFMPKYTFPEMETSDLMIIEYSEAGAGLGMCADHAFCHGVPLYLIAKTGSKISTTVNSVAEKVIFYDDIADITAEFKKLIDAGELKTNSKTCTIN